MLSVVCGISYLCKKLGRGHDTEDKTEHFPVHAAVHTDIKLDLKQPNCAPHASNYSPSALNRSSNASKGDIPDTQIVEEVITKVDAIRVESVARSEALVPNTETDDRVDASDEVIGACSAEFTNAEDSIHGYLTCPYFSDPKTISFIRQSTTMFIMRGLPGSGKSTIVRFLRHLYPNSVVCSADDYFQQANGEYEFKWAKLPSTTVKWPVQVVAQREDGLSVYVKLDNSVFDQSKLSQAHAECQDKATTQCEADRPVVIIDNTNIMRWEMGFYLRLAQNERFYHTFIVEPQTPWRHDVVELAKRNKHGVDEDVLYKKLQSLQKSDVFPLYYGSTNKMEVGMKVGSFFLLWTFVSNCFCQPEMLLPASRIVLGSTAPVSSIFTCRLDDRISINRIFTMQILRMRTSWDTELDPICQAVSSGVRFVNDPPADMLQRGQCGGGLDYATLTSSTVTLTLTTEDILCSDKGTYQCKLVYQDSQSNIVTLVNNATLDTCDADNSFRLASIYADHMVLQCAPQRAQIWGYGSIVGNTVNVVVSGGKVNYTITTTVEQRTDGKQGAVWRALLPAIQAGGPYDITITSQNSRIVLHDVLFGDVWFCSGQSNMVFKMSQVFNHTQELVNSAHFNNIRILAFGLDEANETLDEAKRITVPWQQPKNDRSTGYFSAVCLMYAMKLAPVLNRPLGMIESAWGGTKVEYWMSDEARNSCANSRKRARPSAHGNLWNAMVYPVLNTTIYGAIWYQGESNGGQPEQYYCLFPSMIDDWRKNFHAGSQSQTKRDFPFGFVQIAANQNQTSSQAFAAIRWSQTSYFGYVPNPRMKNVFMAVALDLPDFDSPYGSIHPRDKQDVAARLALAGRAVAYGESNLDFQGPFPTTFRMHGHTDVEIEYDNGNSVIDVRQNGGFEVCCGHDYNISLCYPAAIKSAPITSHDDSHVTIDISACTGYRSHVIQIRYLWHQSPCPFKMCPIYGRVNVLPAPPFIKNLVQGQTVFH